VVLATKNGRFEDNIHRFEEAGESKSGKKEGKGGTTARKREKGKKGSFDFHL